MLTVRDLRQHRRRLTLRSGHHDDQLVRLNGIDLVEIDQHVVGDIQDPHAHRHLDVGGHTVTGNRHLATVFLRGIGDLLNT